MEATQPGARTLHCGSTIYFFISTGCVPLTLVFKVFICSIFYMQHNSIGRKKVKSAKLTFSQASTSRTTPYTFTTVGDGDGKMAIAYFPKDGNCL